MDADYMSDDPKPREWWLSPNGQNVYDTREKALTSTLNFDPPIHVLEVIKLGSPKSNAS